MKITVRVLTDAPPATVFATVTDVLHWPEFIPGILMVQPAEDGPLEPGASFYETRSRLGFRTSEELGVEVVDHPKRFTLLGAPNRFTLMAREYVIGHTGHETELTISFTSEPRGLIGQLTRPFTRFFAPGIERRLEQDLYAIKEEAERRTV